MKGEMNKRLTRSEWLQTPYAASESKHADKAVEQLLSKYKVIEYQWTQARGPAGRPAVILRFNLQNRTYRIAIETLDVQNADASELMVQVKRAIFWMLKSTLEAQDVFITAEQALFAFLELPDGATMYEGALPHMQKMIAADFAGVLKRHMLPAPEGT